MTFLSFWRDLPSKIKKWADRRYRIKKHNEQQYRQLKAIQDMDGNEFIIKKSELEAQNSLGSKITTTLFSAFITGFLLFLISIVYKCVKNYVVLINNSRKITANQLLEAKITTIIVVGISLILIIFLILCFIFYFRKFNKRQVLLNIYRQESETRKSGNRHE